MADFDFDLTDPPKDEIVVETVVPLPESEFFTVGVAEDFGMLNWMKPYLKGIDGVIAGGAFKNVFGGEPVKDLDIFFESEEKWAKAVKKLRKRKWKEIYANPRVIAFVHPKSGIRVELIGAETDQEFGTNAVVYYSPEGTLENFDFTVTKFLLGKAGDRFYVMYHPKFFEHLYLKRLSIDAEMVKPLSTFERTLRYLGYGYKLCRDSKIKLVNAIGDEPMEDEAQLSASFYDGVD